VSGPDVLKRIASRTMPLDQAEKWLDHLSSCSPAIATFPEFRQSHELRKNAQHCSQSQASIWLLSGIAGWVLMQRHNETLVAQTAVLDLRNRSLPRALKRNSSSAAALRGSVAPPRMWNILSPLCSNDGPYDIRLLAGSGELLVSTKAARKTHCPGNVVRQNRPISESQQRRLSISRCFCRHE